MPRSDSRLIFHLSRCRAIGLTWIFICIPRCTIIGGSRTAATGSLAHAFTLGRGACCNSPRLPVFLASLEGVPNTTLRGFRPGWSGVGQVHPTVTVPETAISSRWQSLTSPQTIVTNGIITQSLDLRPSSTCLASFNQSQAADWAVDKCPNGPRRHFGACRAIRGVVVQDRAGETHVLAVGFDIHITGRDSAAQIQLVVTR
jgi:hypothetical protein